MLPPDGADQFVTTDRSMVYNLVRGSGGQVTGILKGGEAYGRVGDIQPFGKWEFRETRYDGDEHCL